MLDDHLSAPRGLGRLPGAPHTGAAGGAACGDLVRVSVSVRGGRVCDAGFDARGCDAVRAAGSAVVDLVTGAAVLEAARITPADAARELGGLSPRGQHAAALATDALHRALGLAASDGAVRLEARADRTLVAMSGGVDSALAAQLALDAGHQVIGVTLELWADSATDGERSCCSPQAVTGARALAHGMGIAHLTLDSRQRFRAEVVDDFLSEHAAGRTPNPCVRCNGRVRFEEMLRLAGRLGAGRLATGHYARIEADADGALLRSADDRAKDQAYMLARVAPEQLERLWFPLGALTKAQTRARARAALLPVADRRESQDLCFLSGIGRERFMARHGSPSNGAGAGDIVAMDGRVLGRHGGQERFTIGQRRGIGVAAAEPLYVVDKDRASGRVVVGPRATLATTRVGLGDVVLHRSGARVDRVRLRYRSGPVPCRIEGGPPRGEHERLWLSLDEPVHGVAPGQTACLLERDRVLGAATIVESRPDGVRRAA